MSGALAATGLAARVAVVLALAAILVLPASAQPAAPDGREPSPGAPRERPARSESSQPPPAPAIGLRERAGQLRLDPSRAVATVKQCRATSAANGTRVPAGLVCAAPRSAAVGAACFCVAGGPGQRPERYPGIVVERTIGQTSLPSRSR
jgi:hypothetical protein